MAENLPAASFTGRSRFSPRTIISILLLVGLVAGLIGYKAHGAALAVLIAGPAINLASLLVIVRQSHWKVALLVAAAVWTTAVAAGFLIG